MGVGVNLCLQVVGHGRSIGLVLFIEVVAECFSRGVEDDGALDIVAKLADVVRPVVLRHIGEHRVGEGVDQLDVDRRIEADHLQLVLGAGAVVVEEDVAVDVEVGADGRDGSGVGAGEDPADVGIGVIMRAGCEPTVGQMSKLMDNPIGNVAMWISRSTSSA